MVEVVDYVPFSFADFGVQDKRDEFLKSKNLLTTMQEMDALIKEKCEYYDDSVKAYNSVIIEWLDRHPEFESVIDKDSSIEYQNMENNDEFIKFIDLLYDVELPSEKKVWVPPKISILEMILVFNYLILIRKMKFMINMDLVYYLIIYLILVSQNSGLMN